MTVLLLLLLPLLLLPLWRRLLLHLLVLNLLLLDQLWMGPHQLQGCLLCAGSTSTSRTAEMARGQPRRLARIKAAAAAPL
jgi:hypothetical protein